MYNELKAWSPIKRLLFIVAVAAWLRVMYLVFTTAG